MTKKKWETVTSGRRIPQRGALKKQQISRNCYLHKEQRQRKCVVPIHLSALQLADKIIMFQKQMT